MQLPRFRDVQALLGVPLDTLSSAVPTVMWGAFAPGSEAALVVAYLISLGLGPHTTDELFDAIDSLGDEEEELSAFRCQEGVAVTCASDGWWVLFAEPGRG